MADPALAMTEGVCGAGRLGWGVPVRWTSSAEARPTGAAGLAAAVSWGRLGWIAAVVLLAVAPGWAASPAGKVVALTTQPGSTLERDASRLMAEDINSARQAKEEPVMLVGSAHLAVAGGPAALFVQVQSASLCGSAGCSTSVFVKRGHGWKRVLDSVSGPIKEAPRTHHGMHDLLVHGNDRWIWDGETYVDTLPAPAVHLKP